MNIRCSALIIFILSLPILVTYSTLVRAETSLKTLFGSGTSGPITITGTGPMELKNDKKNNMIIMIWVDNVHAINDDLTLDCNRLEIYYKNTLEKDKSEKQSDSYAFDKIDRMVITGDIKIARTDGSSATAEKVVYDKADEKVIMTGDPVVVKQDKNLLDLEGSKITYDLKEGAYFVEGTDFSRPKVVIYPKESKGK
jgi:lipopolysaccharide transport protein LptA